LTQQAFFENPEIWKRCVDPDDLPAVEAALSGLQAGSTVSCEYRIRRPDGTLRWIQAKLKPVRGPGGETVRVDGIMSDITERKELEAQSLRAQRMENLGRLAGGIAHDLNNVLSPIVMGIELLRKKHRDAQTVRTMAAMELCATRGTNLVKQILMFARGVDGERMTLDPSRSIRDLERMLLETFPRSIRIVTDIEPELWTVLADQTQLEQVIMNLCVNARDAMPDGGTLTIRARNETRYVKDPLSPAVKAAKYVVILVSDTGGGIPGESLELIFEPFFTTKEQGAGTGLGLSTVNSIVKRHGGFVRVESSASKGTTFRVYLPARASDVPQRDSRLAAGDLMSGNGELILLVDDEVAMRDLCRTIMENYGYRVLTAGDGAEAVALYSDHREDIRIVITDLDMPNMSGGELILALEGINPSLRVISASGLIEEGAFGQAVGGSIRAVLRKPFPPAQLLRTLRDVLRAP
jgi:signal transduction histidine kinase/CheY-like chemotaxis protein